MLRSELLPDLIYLHCLLVYRSESPSQVFLILLGWLLSIMKQREDASHVPEIILAYDNMCNVCTLKVARRPLPFAPPLDQLWLSVTKIIDKFHFRNHVDSRCRELYSPDGVKDKYPKFNTQAGEQTFVWVGRFKHILCSMSKTHHLFYLHRMVRRRNAYTCKCYQYGRKPILPKRTHADL